MLGMVFGDPCTVKIACVAQAKLRVGGWKISKGVGSRRMPRALRVCQ